jgi:hypothetical protein
LRVERRIGAQRGERRARAVIARIWREMPGTAREQREQVSAAACCSMPAARCLLHVRL